MRIDAHQHFWRLARGDYGWLTPALPAIHRDFLPDDLAPLLARAGIARTILVQAAPTVAETEFLLELAAETEFVAGVVGWVDFLAADAPQVIARLARNPLLVGLRPMVHDIADPDWLVSPALAPALQVMIDHRLVFDALVRPQHLSRLLLLLDRWPGLAVVVDHGAKPAIRARRFEPWRVDIAAIAERPQAACKLSGLVTEAAPDWTTDDLEPYVMHLLATFGPHRVLWGSDWPVVTLAAEYERWLAASQRLLEDLTPFEREAVMGGTAARVYLAHAGRR